MRYGMYSPARSLHMWHSSACLFLDWICRLIACETVGIKTMAYRSLFWEEFELALVVSFLFLVFRHLSVMTQQEQVQRRPEALWHIDTLPNLQFLGYELKLAQSTFWKEEKRKYSFCATTRMDCSSPDESVLGNEAQGRLLEMFGPRVFYFN